MTDREKLEQLFREKGFSDFRWIDAREIIVSQWVRFRCIYGCPSYGKGGTCPPNAPSVEETRQMLSEYSEAVIFHFVKEVDRPEDRKDWSKEVNSELVRLEREVFLSGFYKAFLLSFDSCQLCKDCPGSRAECKNPRMARPGADALGIDVFATVRKAGYPIEVLKDYKEAMNRYAFLLVE